MKSLNPYCPRNQGVTPITNGGTGATTAEDALKNLGGVKRNDLGSIMPGQSYTDEWMIGFNTNGGSFLVPIVATGNISIKAAKLFDGTWHDCAVNYSTRVCGMIYVSLAAPVDATTHGHAFLVSLTFNIF